MLTLFSYLTLLSFCIGCIHFFRSHPPIPPPTSLHPLSSTETPHHRTTPFQSKLVYQHLQWLAASPRPIGSKANALVRSQLANHLSNLIQTFPHRQLQVLHGEGQTTYSQHHFLFPFLGKEELFNTTTTIVLENSNIYFRIPGSNELESGDRSSLLLSAHIDSVPSSHGVGDNALSVATLLEIIRLLLLEKPLAYSLLFCFNNGEEIMLQGSMELVHHKELWKDVIAFINFDAMCPTGRPLLFRSSSSSLLHLFKTYVTFPHAHSLGQEIMDRGWMHSLTDYSIYSHLGQKPGLDFAFYDNRWVYHTMDDQLHLLSSSSILHLAHYTWTLLHAIHTHGVQSLQPSISTTKFVYFDILGHCLWMMSFSRFTLLCIGSGVFFFLLNIYAFKKKFLISVGDGGWWVKCLSSSLLLGILIPWLAMSFNPHISSGYPYLPPFLSLMVSITFLLFFVNRIRSLFSPTLYKISTVIAYFHLFCLCISAGSSFFNSSIFAHWYLSATIYLSVYTLVAYARLWKRPWCPLVFFMVPSLITFPMLLDWFDAFLLGLSFTVQEGTPLLLLATFYAFFLFPLQLHFLPWLLTRPTKDLRTSLTCSWILFGLTLALTLFLWPYPTNHPLKVHARFHQVGNAELQNFSTDHVAFHFDSIQSNLPISSPSSTPLSSLHEPLLLFPETSFLVHSTKAKITFQFPKTGGILMCILHPTGSAYALLPSQRNVTFPFTYIHSTYTSFQVDVIFLPTSLLAPFMLECQFSNTEWIHPHLPSLIHTLPLPSHVRWTSKTWDFLVSKFSLHFRSSTSAYRVPHWKRW